MKNLRRLKGVKVELLMSMMPGTRRRLFAQANSARYMSVGSYGGKRLSD